MPAASPVGRDTLLQRLRDHIHTVVGRYRGRIKGWDVVNEALSEDGTLRQSPWLTIIGEDYIAKAFQFAREADPDAELYYNDYSLENAPKRDGAVTLIKRLQAEGIRVNAVGLQGHDKMDWPSLAQQDSTITAFAALGVKVMITELDGVFLKHRDVITRVTFWGVADGDSWLNDGRFEEGRATRYCSIVRAGPSRHSRPSSEPPAGRRQ